MTSVDSFRKLAIGSAVFWAASSCALTQGSHVSAQPEAATWIDPVLGDDVHGDGTMRAPFKTVSRYLQEAAILDALDGDVILGDFDGDGDQDLIRRLESRARFFRNESASSSALRFAFAGTIQPDLPGISSFVSIDMDLDGLDDLLFTSDVWSPVFPLVGSLMNTGVGPGGAPQFVRGADPQSNGSGIRFAHMNQVLSVGDVDADGILDLVRIWFNRDARTSHCVNGWVVQVYYGTGNRRAIDFRGPLELQTVSGPLVFCGLGAGVSPCLLDVDGDGDDDLFLSTGRQVLFYEQISPALFGTGIILIDHSNDPPQVGLEIERSWERYGDGRQFLVLKDGWIGTKSYDGYYQQATYSLLPVSFRNGRIQAGTRIPMTLTGELEEECASRIHLAAGTYSAASGEVFPWNLDVRGVTSIEGEGRERTIIDGGGEDVLRFRRQWEMFWPRTDDEYRLPVRDLSITNAARGVWFPWFAWPAMERVRFTGCDIAVMQAGPHSAVGSRRFHGFFQDVDFDRNRIAVDLYYGPIAGCDFVRCTVSNNVDGIFVAGKGRYTLRGCRLTNQSGLALSAFSSEPCVACPPSEQLMIDVQGSVFADNADHVEVTSGSSQSSNMRVALRHSNLTGGGRGFFTSPQGVELAEVDVRSSIVRPGGSVADPNFAHLDIAFSSVNDPIFVGANGNVDLVPGFAISAEDGHLAATSPLRGLGDPSLVALGLQDIDRDSIGFQALPDIGADEVLSPAVVTAPFAFQGRTQEFAVVGEPPVVGWLLLGTELARGLRLGDQRLLVDPIHPTTIAVALTFDARGVARMQLPIPAAPNLQDLLIYSQAVVLHSPGGSTVLATSDVTPWTVD